MTLTRTLPEGHSAGALGAGMLPSDAHYVKAFGTVAADALQQGRQIDQLLDDRSHAATFARHVGVNAPNACRVQYDIVS